MQGDASGPRRPWWRALTQGIPVGTIAGTRLVITPSWFLAAVVTTMLTAPLVRLLTGVQSAAFSAVIAATMAVLLGLSVLIHELGHCLAASAYGIRVPEVRLYFVGGASELERESRTPAEEAVIAAAGPWASAVLTGASWALVAATDHGSVAWLLAAEMAWANGIITVFNILPALPLDGGRVLSAGLWWLTGRPRPGVKAGVIGGLLLAAALLVWAALELGRGRGGVVAAVVIATMALFVATGAWSEWPSSQSTSSEDTSHEDTSHRDTSHSAPHDAQSDTRRAPSAERAAEEPAQT